MHAATSIDKWRLVGGRVYRLAQVFENSFDAVALAKNLKQQGNCVFLSKTNDSRWAVYWRSKEDIIECDPKFFSIDVPSR
jgi:hypothetical protein